MPPQLLKLAGDLMNSFVVGDYAALDNFTDGNRLTGKDLFDEIVNYGRPLIAPSPDDLQREINFGSLEEQANSFWVDMPFFTKEEGRSDLEVRYTVSFLEDGSVSKIEIADILVP